MLETHTPTTSTMTNSPIHSGDVRRFGPDGVLYEVLKVIDDQKALIRVIDTDEQLAYAISKILADPNH